MPIRRLVSIARLNDLPDGKPRLIKAHGARFACVRRGDRVDVLDDRCPHEGHPLSGGHVRDGVLTCPWHNWKLDLATGRCVFGGEAARRYPTEVVSDELRGRDERPPPPALPGSLDDRDLFLLDLLDERRREAVGRVLGLPEGPLSSAHALSIAGLAGRASRFCRSLESPLPSGTTRPDQIAAAWSRGDAREALDVVDHLPESALPEALDALARRGALSPRAFWAGAGRGASLAEALRALGLEGSAEVARSSARAMIRALLDEPPSDL